MGRNRCRELPVTRRSFVAATVLAASTAGCTGLRQQFFEATPVGLNSETQDELSLEEFVFEEVSTEVDGPADTALEITSYTTGYSRAAAMGGQ
ncbi:hypothetical protein [Halodesulfurarchaeum sp.]|uniref:hypothetical protein n=1 Tax=Halodesulfurarchaeum sp. TaxID=1980530 RepID=UPI002FC314F8